MSTVSPELDHRVQIGRLQRTVQGWGADVRRCRAAAPERVGLRARGAGPPSVVVGEMVAAELGKPPGPSHAMVLVTREASLVEDGRVSCAGPDLDAATPERELPIAQVVVLAMRDGPPPDPFELASTQYLANRLDGVMARTVPGRLWLRFSRDALARGMRLCDLGSALVGAYHMDFQQVAAAEVVLATDVEKVASLDTVAAEARVLAGEHRKLVLQADGVAECADLDCDHCDQRAVCDALRDVHVRYRRRSTG